MATLDLNLLADRHRRGYAPSLEEARAAIAAGRLWSVDTERSGHDSYVIAADGDEAVGIVADHAEVPVDWPEKRGWWVEQVTG